MMTDAEAHAGEPDADTRINMAAERAPPDLNHDDLLQNFTRFGCEVERFLEQHSEDP